MNHSDFWAHVHISDGTSHGMGLVSPPCKTEADLRAWIANARLEYGHKESFQLNVYRRTWQTDDKGDSIPGSGEDRALLTHEQMPNRDRHMAFVKELGDVLKNVEKPLARGRKPREPKVDEEPF